MAVGEIAFDHPRERLVIRRDPPKHNQATSPSLVPE
jgi:hypothetical protein